MFTCVPQLGNQACFVFPVNTTKVPEVTPDSWRSTYNSRPMAGPFGSTSDTTTVVSPLSGLGLSLPPDMANPNPSLESCHYERETFLKNF